MSPDLNWKTWGLTLVIAIGATVELVKHLPSGGPKWERESYRTAQALRPYASSARSRAAMGRQAPATLPVPNVRTQTKYVPPQMTKQQLDALLAQQNKPGQADSDKDKVKKKDDGEWEIVVDPKTGKRIKRRKKKTEDKKEETKKDEAKPAIVKTDDKRPDHSPSTDSDIEGAIGRYLTTGQLAPIANNKPDDAFNSADEWIKTLMGHPDLAETNRFIDHYKKSLVSPEVFYRVVGMMLDDPRVEMKKLGVLACSATPSLMSFQALAKVDTNPKTDASVKTAADAALTKYVDPGYIGTLGLVLKAGSSSATLILATKTIQASAEKNLQPQAATSGGPTPAPGAAKGYTAAYQRIMPSIQALTTSSDPAVKDQATQTLGVLNSLVGSSTTAAL